METRKKERYIILQDGQEIGRAHSVTAAGILVGCTRAHIYHQINEEGFFRLKKITYQLVDRLA